MCISVIVGVFILDVVPSVGPEILSRVNDIGLTTLMINLVFVASVRLEAAMCLYCTAFSC